MLICHSLRCKQMDMSTADRLISTFRNNAGFLYRLSEVMLRRWNWIRLLLEGASTQSAHAWLTQNHPSLLRSRSGRSHATLPVPPENRELKKLRRQLQGKRLIKIELCVKLSLLRLFHVDHFVQNRRSALSLAWYEWFSYKGKEEKICCCKLPLSTEPQIWKIPVVVWHTMSKNCTKKRAARAARLFFFIQAIKSSICGVVVDVAVVRS